MFETIHSTNILLLLPISELPLSFYYAVQSCNLYHFSKAFLEAEEKYDTLQISSEGSGPWWRKQSERQSPARSPVTSGEPRET